MVDTENPPLRLLSINPKAKIIIILQLLPYNNCFIIIINAKLSEALSAFIGLQGLNDINP